MECGHCGHKNKDKALYCNLCGEVLFERDADGTFHQEPMIGTSYDAFPSDDELKRIAAAARRFLIVLLGLLALPVALILVGWKARPEVFASGLGEIQRQFPLPIAALLIYFSVLFGYLTAKTGQAIGAPFFRNWLLASFPPLAPLVWARVGMRSPWRPYLYFMIDGLILAGGIYFLHAWPYLLLVMGFCMTPFIIYQFLGCAIGPVASLLGLYPSLVVLWLCLGPILLGGILLWEMIGVMSTNGPIEEWMLTCRNFQDYICMGAWFNYSFFTVAASLYLLATACAWIKTVYEDLKLPML